MRKILIALALCLMMIVLIASPAFAATQKLTLLKFEGTTFTPAGSAALITNQGDRAIEVNVTVKGATANTRYDVYLVSPEVLLPGLQPGDLDPYKIGSLKTNRYGNWGGQNSQYSFQKVFKPGTYSLFLILINWLSVNPEGEPTDGIVSGKIIDPIDSEYGPAPFTFTIK